MMTIQKALAARMSALKDEVKTLEAKKKEIANRSPYLSGGSSYFAAPAAAAADPAPAFAAAAAATPAAASAAPPAAAPSASVARQQSLGSLTISDDGPEEDGEGSFPFLKRPFTILRVRRPRLYSRHTLLGFQTAFRLLFIVSLHNKRPMTK